MLLQPDCAPTHLVRIQEFFSPVCRDVLFALQEAQPWVTNKINDSSFFDHQLGNDLTDGRFIDSVHYKLCLYVS